jgi:hypothetical protein
MGQKQNITTSNNICLNWPGYSSCDRIGTRKLEGSKEFTEPPEDLWLCENCHKEYQLDEERISQSNQLTGE